MWGNKGHGSKSLCNSACVFLANVKIKFKCAPRSWYKALYMHTFWLSSIIQSNVLFLNIMINICDHQWNFFRVSLISPVHQTYFDKCVDNWSMILISKQNLVNHTD